MQGFRQKVNLSLTFGILLLIASNLANAHHSFSIFAIEHKISLTGVLTDIRFINPHIMMEFETTTLDGAKKTWEVESMAPSRFDRLGNDRDFIKVGDTATFYGWPARNCTDFMALSAIEIASKGTMVLTEEVRQGSAQAAVPDETDLCDSWAVKPVEGPKEDSMEIAVEQTAESSNETLGLASDQTDEIDIELEVENEAEDEGFWKGLFKGW